MTTPTATVHIYRPPGASPLRDEDLTRRQAAATRLLESCSVPAQTSTSAAFVQLHKPLQPSPSSKTYHAHPPESISPQKLRTSRLDPQAGDDDSPVDTANLPSFTHWRPSSSSSSAVPLQPTPSLLPPTQQTQGILRKRTAETTTAGAWAPAEMREKKKKVRVESPRTTTAAAAAGVNGADGRRGARELVPATPEKVMAAGKKEVEERVREEGEEPDLGHGAIERCIPYPYCHTSTIPCSDPNPARQHPARILHSFADPSFTSPSSTSNTLVTGGASLAQSHSLVRVNSGSSQLSQLAITSPATLAFLQPGRRGSWLVPISGPLPIPHTSVPRWFSRPPSSSSSTTTSTSPSLPLPIDWTDDRLRALWALLDSLHSSGGLGCLRVNCHIPPRPPSSSSSAPSMPSYLKITTDAHLALPLRGVLNQLNVKAMLHSSSSSSLSSRRRKKEGEGGGEDGEKFLKGRAIVWVDEMGRAVLTA